MVLNESPRPRGRGAISDSTRSRILDELQKQVTEYDKRFGWTNDKPEHTVLHMQEEVGEIAREMLKKTGYKKEEFDKEKISDEITDLLYLTLKLGNLLNINLDKGWKRIGKRYSEK